MAVYWIAELPDRSGSNGSHTRIAIDGASNVHLLYVDDTTTSLMHAIGTPRPFTPGGGAAAVYGGYQWTLENLEGASFSDPNYYWSDPDYNDLAVDSKGRLHLCLFNMSQLSHAVWDDSAGQFVLTVLERNLGSLWGVAMTIGKDDSVHIAYALNPDAHGKATLKYATRATGAKDTDPFQLMPIDNRYGWFSNLSIATSGGKTGVSYINGVWASSSMNPNSSDSFMIVYAEKTTSTGWTTELADPGPMASGLPPNVFGAYYADRGTNSLIFDTNGAPISRTSATALGYGMACDRQRAVPGLATRKDTAASLSMQPGRHLQPQSCSIRVAFCTSSIKRRARWGRSSGTRRAQVQVLG